MLAILSTETPCLTVDSTAAHLYLWEGDVGRLVIESHRNSRIVIQSYQIFVHSWDQPICACGLQQTPKQPAVIRGSSEQPIFACGLQQSLQQSFISGTERVGTLSLTRWDSVSDACRELERYHLVRRVVTLSLTHIAGIVALAVALICHVLETFFKSTSQIVVHHKTWCHSWHKLSWNSLWDGI